MAVGTVKEIKSHEYRIGLTPSCVKSFVSRGHAVLFERGAGLNAGAVARSSTLALTSTTLPYSLLIAEHGLEAAAERSPALMKGVNIYKGKCVYKKVAEAFTMEAHDFSKLTG